MSNETLLETGVCDNMHKKRAFRLSPKAQLFSVGGVGGMPAHARGKPSNDLATHAAQMHCF